MQPVPSPPGAGNEADPPLGIEDLVARAYRARRTVLPHSRPLTDLDPVDGTHFAAGAAAMQWFTSVRTALEEWFQRLVDQGEHEIVARFAVAAGPLWEIAGHGEVLHHLYRNGVAAADAAGHQDYLRLALLGEADALWASGRAAEARAAYERSLAHGVVAADWWTVGFAHRGIASLSLEAGDTATAQPHLESAEVCFQRCGDPRGAVMVLRSRASLAHALGDDGGALGLAARAVEECRALGDAWTLAWMQLELGRLLHATGDCRAAVPPLEAAAATFEAFQDATRRRQADRLRAAAAADVRTATGRFPSMPGAAGKH